MTRTDAIRIINDLYGAPGEGWDTEQGRMLLNNLAARLGLKALTDEAVVELAQRHLDEQDRDMLVLGREGLGA